MADFKIHTTIQSQYCVFDASGDLPFSIVFGLCRHSSADLDPRPLVLYTKETVFDVPWALANGLLSLHEVTSDGEVQLDTGHLDTGSEGKDALADTITLPSPVGRTDNWRNTFATFFYGIQPGSPLSSRLQTGKTYTMRMTGLDLGVKQWHYLEASDEPESSKAKSSEPKSKSSKLINQKSTSGKATFKVVSSLPQPPRLSTHLIHHSITPESSVLLEISALNTSSNPITAQTRGHQRFLTPSTPFFRPGEDDISDHRTRLIDVASERYPPSALQIVDLRNGDVVYQMPRPTSAPLTQGHDPRPKAQDLVELKPGEPVVRHVDVSNLLKHVPGGRYGVRMAPRGMWWCEGSLEDVVEEDGERVAKGKWNTTIPPLMLESGDIVEVEVRNGRGVEFAAVTERND